jgi:hypothetical protein
MVQASQGTVPQREAASEGRLADEVMERLGLFFDYTITERH